MKSINQTKALQTDLIEKAYKPMSESVVM